MRISGGQDRGRTLRTPPEGVLRPTQDAVREALFSMLATVVPGCGFVDLYAGTGAVGLEARSRGAARVIWVEKSPRSLRCLEANLAAFLGPAPYPEGFSLARADALAWLRRPTVPRGSVSVVFADPPYVEREGEGDGSGALLEAAAASGMLAERAFFAMEQRAGTPPPEARGWERLALRRYGRTQIVLLCRDAVEDRAR